MRRAVDEREAHAVICRQGDPAMRLSKIDLNLFVVFDAIYTKRNLTRAA